MILQPKDIDLQSANIKEIFLLENTWPRGNSNVYLQYMLLKIRKKTIWKFTFSKYHVHCLYLF